MGQWQRRTMYDVPQRKALVAIVHGRCPTTRRNIGLQRVRKDHSKTGVNDRRTGDNLGGLNAEGIGVNLPDREDLVARRVEAFKPVRDVKETEDVLDGTTLARKSWSSWGRRHC